MPSARWTQLVGLGVAGRRGLPPGGRFLCTGAALALAGALALSTRTVTRSIDVRKSDGSDQRTEATAFAGARTSATLDALLGRANYIAGSDGKTSLDGLTEGPGPRDRWVAPTAGWVTSPFLNERLHPILRKPRPHRGVDISAPWGSPIVAPAPGRVVFAGLDPSYGRTVIIDHGQDVVTVFAHCSKILVRAGQRVSGDEPIALVGDTGLSTGPHLHYEVRVGGRKIDPTQHTWR